MGNKHWKTKYKNGIFFGKSESWSADGIKDFEVEFENGKLIQ